MADSSPLHVERMEQNSCSVPVPSQETCFSGKSFHMTLWHNTNLGAERAVLEAKLPLKNWNGVNVKRKDWVLKVLRDFMGFALRLSVVGEENTATALW